MSEPSSSPGRDWSELFPDQDYRFYMGLKQGKPADFFSASSDYAEAIAERRQWLAEAPERHAVILGDGMELLVEAHQLARDWKTLPEFLPPTHINTPVDGWYNLLELGRNWEVDFLLLRTDGQNAPRLMGGCVCFPSSWSLEDKTGQPIDFIHETVPGLNASVGRSVTTFLNKLRPDVAWLRANWGLAAVDERNMHPMRGLPRLQPPVSLEEVWLRIEDQALVGLPENDGVLFGIRLRVYSLSEVVKDPVAKRGLLRALKTMPDEVAEYKGLSSVREGLVHLLGG